MANIIQTWEGWFSVRIPETWGVRGEGGVIEMHPDDGPGVIHFSFLRKKDAAPPTVEAALEILRLFAEKNGLASVDPLTTSLDGDFARVYGSFSAKVGADPTARHWELCCVLWRDAALRASWIHDGTAANIRTRARDLFVTIERA